MRPTSETDAYEDDTPTDPPMIFLAGPIKHWWTCWGSEGHKRYVAHRDMVRALLIHHGYLTYAPWDAIKGTWNPRAQAVNDVAIATADLMVILTPAGIPADGTEGETAYAGRVHTPTMFWTPIHEATNRLAKIRWMVGLGQSYE